MGSKKNPIWRVVVADQRSPRDGRIIESIGHYNPQTEPSTIKIDRERFEHWVERGAQPTNTVRKLVRAPNTETAVVASPIKAAAVPEDPEPAVTEPTGEDVPAADAADADPGQQSVEADASAPS